MNILRTASSSPPTPFYSPPSSPSSSPSPPPLSPASPSYFPSPVTLASSPHFTTGPTPFSTIADAVASAPAFYSDERSSVPDLPYPTPSNMNPALLPVDAITSAFPDNPVVPPANPDPQQVVDPDSSSTQFEEQLPPAAQDSVVPLAKADIPPWPAPAASEYPVSSPVVNPESATPSPKSVLPPVVSDNPEPSPLVDLTVLAFEVDLSTAWANKKIENLNIPS